MKSNELTISSNKPLQIFETNDDKTGTDITKMSNFFNTYINQLSNLETNKIEEINDYKNIGIEKIKEVITQSRVLDENNYILKLDYQNIPKLIKEKLEKGIYKIGESKTVNGNFRAVILDENNVRVKDITLKKEINNDSINELEIQLQMKEIYNKLNEIQDLQNYQIELDKSENYIVPFLNARDKILEANNESDIEEKRKLLKVAKDNISSSLNSLYSDLNITSNIFLETINNPLKKYLPIINKYMNYMTKDLQIITKYVGVELQLLNYLEEDKQAKIVLDQYNQTINRFMFEERHNNMSLVDLLQDNYLYNDNNRDLWLKIKQEVNKNKLITFNNKDVYLITIDEEEEKNEKSRI